MDDLKIRFGRLVAAHRKRANLTQDALAAAAELSSDMIKQIERGTTGARFPTIERLAAALKVDPAELFTADLPDGVLRTRPLIDLTVRLATMSEQELSWIANLLDAALKPKT